MVMRRIIPCLDVSGGRTVKGVRFADLRDMGDPVALAARYADTGADELVLLDISATVEGRGTFTRVVEDVADALSIPFTVGGGIRSERDAEALLRAGADKVSINSAALADPGLVTRCADIFGAQCIVVAIDVLNAGGMDVVTTHAGTRPTERTLAGWAQEVVSRGAGELLVTSMDRDGTGEGFALEQLRTVRAAVSVPIIASGGAGCAEHFAEAFRAGADGALAAGLFHRGELGIADLKRTLHTMGIHIRC